MNVKRFTARTSRDALTRVRQAFGKDAVVLSTRPCEEGVEVLAMAPDSMQQLQSLAVEASASAKAASPAQAARPSAPAAEKPPVDPSWDASQEVKADAQRLAMSTLSFQDYVRERMLRRRKAELSGQASSLAAPPAEPVVSTSAAMSPADPIVMPEPPQAAPVRPPQAAPMRQPQAAPVRQPQAAPSRPVHVPVLEDVIEPPRAAPAVSMAAAPTLARREQTEMMSELRAMKGLIEDRFSALAFMEKLQRQPRQAMLSQRLLDGGFSPALIRRLVESLPSDVDENTWAASVLARNLATGEDEPALEDAGGVYALIGSTGVGKTTSTAKLAAAFATRHGAANLGLITLDAYRVGAHEQLRAYGRILGVPVHTAHDRASLEDLLDLLSGKRMVLIDTAGMPQRDSRTAELLEMVSHRAVQRLLVINASAQGETIEDVISAYRGASCRGVVLSKIDEAVKIGPALDAVIRHRLKVLAVANGQRVPEDWHRLNATTLVQRAMRPPAAAPAWRLEPGEIHLVFAGASGHAHEATAAAF